MAAPKEKSKIITAIVLDFETGCGKCQESGATQLSAHAIRLDTFECTGTFNEYIYPYDKVDVLRSKKKVLRTKYELENTEPMMYDEEKMLKYTGITMDMLKSKGTRLETVCDNFLDFVEDNTFDVSKNCKPIIVGQNILFDLGFLEQIMLFTKRWKRFCKLVRGEEDFWGNFQPYYIDTILLSQLALSHKKTQNSWSLSFLAEAFNIELVDAHDADADVTATEEVLKCITKRMRNGDENSENEDGIVETKKERFRTHFKI